MQFLIVLITTKDVREMEFLTGIFDKIKGIFQETIDFFASWWWLLLIIGVVFSVAPEVAKRWWVLRSELKEVKRKFERYKQERELGVFRVETSRGSVPLSVCYNTSDTILSFNFCMPVEPCRAITSVYLEIYEVDSFGGSNRILTESRKFDVKEFLSRLDLSDTVIKDGSVEKSVPVSRLFRFLSEKKEKGYYKFDVAYPISFPENKEDVVKRYVAYRKDFKCKYEVLDHGLFGEKEETRLDTTGLINSFFDSLYSSGKKVILVLGLEYTCVPDENSCFDRAYQEKYSVENQVIKL